MVLCRLPGCDSLGVAETKQTIPLTATMKMNCLFLGLATSVVIGLSTGCAKKETPPSPPVVDTNQVDVMKSEASAMVYMRILDRAKSLVDQKDYVQARATLKQFDTMKLTPEQQQAVDALKARIPQN